VGRHFYEEKDYANIVNMQVVKIALRG